MRPRFPGSFAVLALLLAIVPLTGSAGAPLVHAWQDAGNTWESPQFGYVVAWDDQWAAREREERSDPEDGDAMALANNDGLVTIIGRDLDDVSAAELLDDLVAAVSGDPAVLVDDRDADVPVVELQAGRFRTRFEAYTLDDAAVVISLRSRDDDYDTALAAAREGITLNGTPVLTGEAAALAPGDAGKETGEPAGNIVGNAYTSPGHDFIVGWPSQWEASERTGASGYEELTLVSGSGSLRIAAGPYYEGDAGACLAGEDAYYRTEAPDVTGWQPALTSDGQPVAAGDEYRAAGVFTFTYGEDAVDLVDTIECRTLVVGESVMIILATSTPDRYEEHRTATLEVTNAIFMPEDAPPIRPLDLPEPGFAATPVASPQATPQATPVVIPAATPVATPRAVAFSTPDADDGATGLDGNTFTSPGFGFTLEIPADWSIEDESIAEGEESLVLSKGASTVTLHATSDDTGEDLPACISYARALAEEDPAHPDLRLDATSNGDPFQGADDRSAYALFTYEDADGEKWAYFVHCQYIVEGESVLILTQDVPYEDYAAERAARRQIQNAIELP